MKRRAIPVLLCLTMLMGTTACSNTQGTDTDTTEYANSLFDDTYVHTIDIQIDDESWADLLANPTEQTKYKTTVVIDGNTTENVSFATKGNSSLSQVAGSDSDRYSFKINFSKFVEGQTYGGLDKLNLQNIFSDATYMKDYLAYEIMRESGVASPLTSYISVSINGELFGLYLALEDISTSFLERTYEADYGDLYKPETEMLGNMGQHDIKNMERPEGMEPPAGMDGPEGAEDIQNHGQTPTQANAEIGEQTGMPQNIGQRPKGGMGMGGTAKGADLAYTDDEISSYSDIFDNAETDATDEDKARLISSLKQLSTGENLEQCVDVDAVTRYFVAHNFLLNGDSYTGSMLHNYWLYEEDGILTMLPWDYNLAFGGFHMNGDKDATSIVNTAIDTPLDEQNVGNRPMWDKLMARDENLQLYHEYFNKLISDYFESGEFESTVSRVSTMIRPYIENDPTAWYTVDEFDSGVDTITQFCLLRAESIRKQLDGTLASTTDAQEAADMVDASTIDISAMGSQGRGKDSEGRGGERKDNPREQMSATTEEKN